MAGPSAAAVKGAFSVSASLKGARRSVSNIRRMKTATRKQFFEALAELADEILQHSKDKYVPVLTGALKDSGKVVRHAGQFPSAEIGFGGAAVSYAVVQHENLSFNHPRGGSAKYLELAIQDYEPQIADRIKTKVKGTVRYYDMRGKIPGV